MTYPIIFIVILAVIVGIALFAVLTRKPQRLPPTEARPPLESSKRTSKTPSPAGERQPQAKPPDPAAVAEAPAAEGSREPDLDVPVVDAEAGPEPASAPATRPAARPKLDVPGLRKGLAKSRGETGFLGRLAQLFAGKKEIDPNIAEQVEEILLTSDVGVPTTQAILERLREGLKRNELSSPQAIWDALRAEAARILTLPGGRIRETAHPTVVFVVGVNGVGKTTSIGKIATKLVAEGKSVVLAAGDTFRAAAVQQLEIWGRRVGCEVIKGKEGADPAAVIFDAIQRAKQNHIDVVLADSAGRLQTKVPLMDELKKIARTMQKALDGAPHETLLVLDATNGQNATSQARMFQDAIPLTGIILTNFDGTAKGGVILGICDEMKIPVRYVGIGERAEDLREFIADEFVDALFGRSADETVAA